MPNNQVNCKVKCPVKCKGQYSPCDLDKLLIPAMIKDMTYSQQCKYVLSPEACEFRKKVMLMLQAMLQAFQYTNRGSCANPFYVNWESCNGKFNINGKSLAEYYSHYLGANKGFSGLMLKIREHWERQRYVCGLIKNGKYCRPGNRC